MSGAVVEATVLNLWESCGDWVPTTKANHENGSEYLNVYACWKSERAHEVPHVYVSMQCGSMSIGADFLPANARALAANLILGAELAEATAMAIAKKEAAESFAQRQIANMQGTQLSRAPEA